MSRLSKDAQRCEWRWFFGGVLFLACVAHGPGAAAAPIRHALPDPQEMQALDDFLAKGPQYWETHLPPTIPAGINIVNPNGSLKSDLFVAYLEMRWERHPASFDERHPRVGAVMTAAAKAGEMQLSATADALTVPSSSAVKANVVVSSQSASDFTSPTVNPEAQILVNPTTVPEPSSWVVGAALAALGVGCRRRRAR